MWSCWARLVLLAALKRVVKGLAPVMTLEMSELAPSAPVVRPPNAVSKRLAFCMRERVVEGGGAEAVDRGACAGAGERDGAGGADGVLVDAFADLKGVLAVQGDRHRDAVVRIERIREIGEATAPAGDKRFVGDAALPFDLLVVVREKLRRARARSRGDTAPSSSGRRACRRWRGRRIWPWLNSVAELRHRRMDTPGAAVARARRDGQDGVLRKRERAAAGGVGGVGGGVGGDDKIIGIVAAGEEEAHESLVVGLRGGGGARSDGAVVRAGAAPIRRSCARVESRPVAPTEAQQAPRNLRRERSGVAVFWFMAAVGSGVISGWRLGAR
jgi:hypothetical protein